MTVPQHGLTRYLRVRFDVDRGTMRWTSPRTILGIVPVGTHHWELPVSAITQVTLGRVFHPIRVFFGAALVVAPWFVTAWWIALPATLVGLWVILTTIGPHLIVELQAGGSRSVAVCFTHQIDADLFAEAVNGIAGEAQRAADS